MAVGFSNTNKPINPRGNDASPKAFNRAKLYSGKALSFDGVNDTIDLAGFTMSGINASFVFNLKADSWGALDYIFDLSPKRLVFGSQHSGNDISIYDSVSWKKFADFSDTTHTNSFALTIEGTTAKLYLNGQSFGNTLTLSTNIDLSATTQFALMSARNFTGNFFNGQLSGFKIFNTALTAVQVADLYNNPEKVVPTGVANTALKLWLPMQEGAGTTAYDGSGNGNHGTISGATYTHGIGAPVSQTAVIDWNKGTNRLPYSEQFDQWSTFTGSSVTANTTTAPDGQTTADTLNFGSGSESLVFQNYGSGSATFTSSIWAKSSTGKKFTFRHWNGTTAIRSNEFTTTSEWQRFDFTFTDPLVNVGVSNEDNGSTGSIEIWGAQLNTGSVGPYVRTGATAQTSEVLLPQGLTTGRDITGVNLFENVRKQGALNLDGNSWAEVHDNASLDVSEISAEGWMYAESITGTNNRIVNKWNTNYPERSFQLYGQHATINWMLSDGSSAYSITGGTLTQGEWHHVVGTYDGSTQKIYLNGVQVQSTALSITLKQSSFKVMLGGYATGVYTLNPIAQPRIYNRALTASEVLQNYNSGKNTYK